MRNTVFVGPAQAKPDVKERPAAAAIKPGRVMVLNGSDQFALAGADSAALVYFAGEQILGSREDSYEAGDTVQGYRPESGQYYDLQLAASQTIAEDDKLTTNATGDLVALGAGTNVIAYAAEAVTTTGAVGVIRVYIK